MQHSRLDTVWSQIRQGKYLLKNICPTPNKTSAKMTSAAGSWCVTFFVIDTRKWVSSLVLIWLSKCSFELQNILFFFPRRFFSWYSVTVFCCSFWGEMEAGERASQKTQEKHSYSQATKWQECESWLRPLLLTFSHLKEDIFRKCKRI